MTHDGIVLTYESAPWYLRAFTYIQHCWAWIFRRSSFRPFVPSGSHISLKSGYLLMEFMEKERGQIGMSMAELRCTMQPPAGMDAGSSKDFATMGGRCRTETSWDFSLFT